jgi:hypothetical protein
MWLSIHIESFNNKKKNRMTATTSNKAQEMICKIGDDAMIADSTRNGHK